MFRQLLTLLDPGDVETRKATTTYTLGTGLQHQQVGNVWSSPDIIVSLSFSGDMNVFDRRSGEKPVKVLYVRDKVHQKLNNVVLRLGVCRVPRKLSPLPFRHRSRLGRSS